MKSWLKGLIWGFCAGIVILIFSYLLPPFLCPDFFKEGPSYPTPTDQPICSLMIGNPLRTHYPFPKILFVWGIWLLATSIIGFIIGKFKNRNKQNQRVEK